MADAFALYFRLVGAQIRAQLQYRASFALDLFATFGFGVADFLSVLIIFHNVPTLDGWTLHEVAFLYACSSLAFSLVDLAIGQIDLLPRMIREGTFDVLLVRPRGSLFQLVASDFALRRIGRIVSRADHLRVRAHGNRDRLERRPRGDGRRHDRGGMPDLRGGLDRLRDDRVLDGRRGRVHERLDQRRELPRAYPISIYGDWLRRFFAFVVPMAFVCYFPSLYVLDKEDPLGFPRAFQFASPLVAVVAAVAAGIIWTFAVRRYRSVGS